LFWQFQNLGVEVLIANMPNYSRHDRKAMFLRQIREAMAEENRKDIIEKLWKGRQERESEMGNLPVAPCHTVIAAAGSHSCSIPSSPKQ
jgi:hypothetical protein